MARAYSETTALLTAGVTQVTRAKTLLTAIMQAVPELDMQLLISDLKTLADPDLALLSLERIFADDQRHPAGITRMLGERQIGVRTLKLLGASEFFGTYLATHTHIIEHLEEDPYPEFYADMLLASVQANNIGSDENPCWVAGRDANILDLRRSYYALLAQIAAVDVSQNHLEIAQEAFEPTARRISDLVDAALEAALSLARRELDPDGRVAFSVIAMGKTGARELNYISDVDVIYVAEPQSGSDISADEATQVATEMAVRLGSLCSASLEEPALWVLDAALRPEGKDGALVRSLESHVDYYERWAKAWEFQALLKARPAAGDRELGERYLAAISPYVWKAVEREGFVEETRAMRRRVEKLLSPQKSGREIKLGVGGLRDVEFTVQLLQLVHGRVDESLRVRSTLEALRALVAGGYIGRDQGEELARCYQFLRVLEHRTQLDRMRRTHLFPTNLALRRVARSIDFERFSNPDELYREWEKVRRQVRSLHEEIYYRPLLPAMARLSAGEAALDSEAAASRLAVIGYRDPKRALKHIAALTQGVTRRAAIQRQLLPVLLDWLADGVDPDGGLLAFRQVSEALGETHWYLRLLRDSGSAAQRLTRLLSSSPLVADLLPRNPEAIKWLDDDAELAGRTRSELEAEILASFDRQPDLEKRANRLRAIRARELLRCAIVDVLQGIDPARPAQRLTEVGEAVLAGALDLALRRANAGSHAASQVLLTAGKHASYLVVAMGRFGGAECGYPTDADVVFYYEMRDGGDNPEAAREEAAKVVSEVSAILGGAEVGAWEVDTALRPEGKAGPPAKDLNTLPDYLQRWAQVWERQALLRARPIVGDSHLRDRFLSMIDPVRYEMPPTEKEMKEIRRLKARMETERIGLASSQAAGREVKLGPGGLADVEWAVQLLQMRHAHEVPALRTVSTRQGLQTALNAGLLTASQAAALDAAWMLATRVRAANVLGSGRLSGKKLDSVAVDRLLETTAALLGYTEGNHQDLVEDWLRASRLARSVVEAVLY